jgi:hypothetical protein
MLPPMPKPTAKKTIQSWSSASEEVSVSRAMGFIASVPDQEDMPGSAGAGIEESID